MGNKPSVTGSPVKAKAVIKESILIRSYKTKHALSLNESGISVPPQPVPTRPADPRPLPLPPQPKTANLSIAESLAKVSAKLDEVNNKIGRLESRVATLEVPQQPQRVLFMENSHLISSIQQIANNNQENEVPIALGKRSNNPSLFDSQLAITGKMVKGSEKEGGLQAARDKFKLAKIQIQLQKKKAAGNPSPRI